MAGAQPSIPHPLENRGQCLACHRSGSHGVPEDHAGRGNDTCTTCHHAGGGSSSTTSDAGSTSTREVSAADARDAAATDDRGTATVPDPGASSPDAGVASTDPGTSAADTGATAADAGTAAADSGGSTRPSSGPPPIPHSLEGRSQCTGCHSSGPIAFPADHAGRGNDTCTMCHRAPAASSAPDAGSTSSDAGTSAADAGGSTRPSRPPAIPHTLEGRSQCTGCHSSGPLAFPADHAGRTDSMCTGCHHAAAASSGADAGTSSADAGGTRPSRPPMIPHTLEGRSQCTGCHSSGPMAFPADHAGRTDSMCTGCHQPGASPAVADAGPSPADAGGAPPPSGGPPSIPHTLEGRSQCTACHSSGPMAFPADHAGRTDSMCTGCHQPGASPTGADAGAADAGAGEAAPPSGGPPAVPHTLEGRDQCTVCHGEGGLRPMPGDHAGRTDDMCLTCHHAPAGEGGGQPPVPGAGVGGAPAVPHGLQGRDECSLCHSAGGVRPMPADHAGRANGTCLACHQAGGSAEPGAAAGIGDADCLGCHASRGLTVPLPSGDALALYVDTESYRASVHGRAGVGCVGCHEGYTAGPHGRIAAQDRRDYSIRSYTRCRGCHVQQYTGVQDSMHAQALSWGNRNAPICVDCHSAHDVSPPDEPRSAISITCGRCHSTIVAQYRESVHGAALLEDSNPDVPTCSDCHGVHGIHDPRTAEFRLKSPQICARCHADPARMGKYGITADVYDTYVADFHGTTVELFARQSPDAPSNKAVCYDCHGVHDIRKVDDPQSHVIKANLIKTCQRCHPGADPSFIGAWVGHYRPSPSRNPITYYVQLFYRVAIPGILGLMLVLVALDAQKRIRRRRAAKDHPSPSGRVFPRFTGLDRVEHWVMVVSFTMLALTGLPQKFAGHPVAEGVISFFGGIELVRTLHHLFAILLVLETVFHLVTVAYKILVRRVPLSMLPGLQDVRDFRQWLRHVLGSKAAHPAFGRYGFEQKIEYWALLWGTVLMIVTGFVLLVPLKATSILPGEIVPAAKAAHGYEAILAVLAVIVWHFYGVHVAHWNRAMVSGALTEEEMHEAHAAELQRLEQEGPRRPEDDPAFGRRRKLFLPIAVGFVALAVVGLKLLLSENTSLAGIPTVQQTAFAPVTPPPPASDAGGVAPDAAAGSEPGGFRPPRPVPHPVQGRSPCSACHGPGAMKPMPADHEGRGEDVCLMCHHASDAPAPPPPAGPEPAGVSPAVLPAAAEPPDASNGPSPTAADAGSAAADAGSPPAQPGGPPTIPHSLEGRAQCTGCHAAGPIAMPADHAGRTDDMCLMCHQTGGA
ncbi:MAG: cytochrome c3 family protein [Deltaproteobacteria bacterium]|nr:cytochrome c3 family protein [Deltaproteobacteria bacterium]